MTRRQRRAKPPATIGIESAADIPMSVPEASSTRIQGKTLYEIAAERQAQLAPHSEPFPDAADRKGKVRYVKITPDGKTVDATTEEEIADDDGIEEGSPVLDTLFLALSLSALHFTLEVLTVHQYAQELRFPPIFVHTIFVAFPTLMLLIHLLHGHLLLLPAVAVSDRVSLGLQTAKQILFLIVANLTGCYLVALTNDRGYYAVMKNAPSIGTVWVWSVLELGLAGAVAGVAGPGMYAWYHGYGIF